MNSFSIGDLNVPVPIIQGGMGIGVSMAGLASAVANMGGIGIISAVGLGLIDNNLKSSFRLNNSEALKNEIRKARRLTKGILGVNIMSVLTNFSDLVRTSIEEEIDIIFSGAGLPLDLPKYLSKNIKTKLVPIVSSARAASIICNKWWNNFNYLPDALVVEGPKAGGHLGFKATALESTDNSIENLVKDLVELSGEIEQKHQKKIPIIAAGGIYSGEDIYNIIALGASGAQLGSRFVATTECDASLAFKEAFIGSTSDNIRIINSPAGMPGRAIHNIFLSESEKGNKRPERCKYNCIRSCKVENSPYCIADALVAAYRGHMTDGFAFAGTNASRITHICSVENLMLELTAEYATAEKADKHLQTTS